MLKIAIIEDEVKTLKSITAIIEEYCQDVEIKGTATSVKSAIELLNNTSVDLVLSDINLPDGNSFTIFEQLDEIDFKIIFITAFEEFAIKAIKFSAFDYLVKPINPKELVETINKAQKTIEKENASLKLEALLANVKDFSESLKKIILKTSDSIYLIDVQDIVRCESDGSYCRVLLKDGRKILLSTVLKEYEELLSGSGFIRVHRSHLINLNHIDRFNRSEGGYLVMKDGSNIPVSNRKKEQIIDILENMQ